MIPFVLGKQENPDPDVIEGYKKTKLFYLRLCGMYPDLSPRRFLFFGVYVNVIYTQFVYYIVSYSLALWAAYQWADIDLLAEDIEFLCYTCFYCYSSTNGLVRRHALDALLKFVGQDFFQYKRPPTDYEKEIRKKATRIETRVTRFYAVYVAVFLAYFILVHPIGLLVITGKVTSVTNDTVPINKVMPLRVWTPYDTSQPLNYALGAGSQLIAASMLMAIMVGVDMSFVTLMTQLLSQFDLLNASVGDIFNRAYYNYSQGRAAPSEMEMLYHEPEFQKCMHDCLIENIKHHKVLLRYFKQLQGFYGIWLLIVFVGSGLTICSSGFMLSTAEGDVSDIMISSFSKALLFLVSLLNVLFYCWYSEQLSHESAEFRNALYGCPWYNCSGPFKKTLHIALTCTQKHFQITAAGMIPASLATYSDVLKTSYSYFNLMRASNSHGN